VRRAHGRDGRGTLAADTYVEAVCRIGACLADALQYAHDRGLVHLDLKPSNILVAADGQPMVLDFHLARGPLHPDDPPPAWLGGTPGYMPPEQQAALAAVQRARRVPLAVDGRADVYALGVVLYEALAGRLPGDGLQEAPTVLAAATRRWPPWPPTCGGIWRTARSPASVTVAFPSGGKNAGAVGRTASPWPA
jgi:serine/threonine protein kinase